MSEDAAFLELLAKAADLCLKPQRHAVRYSGAELNLMLTRLADENAPLLWHGSHAVWMQAGSGERCERPIDGAPLEALCRRVRALLNPQDP